MEKGVRMILPDNGVRMILPERPDGCCAQNHPDTIVRQNHPDTFSHAVFVLAGVFILLIRAYQLALRPLLVGCCKFHPSCSEYAIQALRMHGLWHGGRLATSRLLRCHPFTPGGIDPVPDPGKGVRMILPERPDGCCAQNHPDTFSRLRQLFLRPPQ